MDDTAKRAYIKTRLNKAREDLASARSLLTLGYLRAAINRAYYTIFHITSAALLWIDVERSRHLGVQSAFGEFLVKSGAIEPEFGRLYVKAREAREEQDYDLDAAPLDIQEAAQIVEDAERFVNRIEQHLRQVGAI